MNRIKKFFISGYVSKVDTFLQSYDRIEQVRLPDSKRREKEKYDHLFKLRDQAKETE